MTQEYRTRVVSLVVSLLGEELFSEMSTRVSIEDEGAGEFVVVHQQGRTGVGKITLNPEEWPSLRAAIDQMIEQCGPVEKNEP